MHARRSWALLRYELTNDVLILYAEKDNYWLDAVRNKQVTGVVDSEGPVVSANVTASKKELRTFVQGYASVIFSEDPLLVLTRVPAD